MQVTGTTLSFALVFSMVGKEIRYVCKKCKYKIFELKTRKVFDEYLINNF
jgi:hypothetical protein